MVGDQPIEQPVFDTAYIVKLLEARMPFGKYKGRLLIDLPETYLCWFERKGFPEGKLGMQLRALYDIKLNGLETMLRPLRDIRK